MNVFDFAKVFKTCEYINKKYVLYRNVLYDAGIGAIFYKNSQNILP